MKLFIDEITAKELFAILVMLPKLLLDAVKEELFWWFVLYPYEITYPINWQRVCRKDLAKSLKRREHYYRHQRKVQDK